MAVTYILYSKKTNKFYVGSSRTNASSRPEAHNAGRTRSTKFGKPWVVVHEEEYVSYTEARQRESFLKTGAGRKWIAEEFGYLKNSTQSGGVA